MMNRSLLTLAVCAGLLATSALFLAGSAGAVNPHGPKSDPSASCGGGSGGKPSGQCDDQGLPQSEGCEHGQAPVQNPHCQTAETGVTPTTPTTPTTTTTTDTPVSSDGPPAAHGVSGKVAAEHPAGAVAGEHAAGTSGAATAADPSSTIDQLPFTGIETLWLVVIGAGMLGCGFMLRGRLSS
jgi:hypothetical protein